MTVIDFNGIQLPNIGIGTWHMGSDHRRFQIERDTIQTGIEHGATVIDTAEMYGNGDSEILVGNAIAPYNRQQLFLISKFYPQHALKPSLSQALTASLARLQTTYLDLYLYHWRGEAPLNQTVAELQALQASGKIRHWGVSNFDLADMQELLDQPGGKTVFANEDLYNLGERGIEYSLIPWQNQRQIPLIAYSPIDAGDSRHHNLATNPTVQTLASKYRVTPYQILLAWTVRNQQTLAIPQTSNPDHMLENIVAGNLTLAADDLAALDQVFPKPNRKEPLAVI
ncbi:aldo/keto reductase [Convivina praedatoris]|uniref:aldo/keto reductase n=1 Tax=Convivina praedatoris TaxID=2880963 RepID=UPI00200CE904|nr:aldo/keto reductase [Convivina sp. LMG 32447]CAH1854150.1 Aldo-keto reductase IolS [Convivina sp. LMG 32447]